MDNHAAEIQEKIRQQFDTGPYPRKPLEASPKDDLNVLFIHNFATPYYLRNQKVIDPQGKVILDAGCGSGYTALALAEANPGAKIIGIDFSENSINLARQRLQYHGFDRAEFHAISIEELPTLGIEFDYINSDDVLYLLPDLASGLRSLKSVLKPDGIIRGNLHSYLQRIYYYRAQKFFKIMRLMDGNPTEFEVELAREIIGALKDDVFLKVETWKPDAKSEEWMLMNYLFQGDKGYTIPEIFSALKEAELEFVNMVNWPKWDLMDLFVNPEDLPTFLKTSLPQMSVEQRLHLFELLQPIHRLLDFWCAHPNQAQPFLPVAEWTRSDWQTALVHLHPQLRTLQVREALIDCIANRTLFPISQYISASTKFPIQVETNVAVCLLPLWEGAQPIMPLVERWLKTRPVHPVTLEPVTEERAFEEVTKFLTKLESFLYVLVERKD